MTDPYAVSEDYWEQFDSEEDAVTVYERITEELEDADRLHGIEIHASNGRAYFGVVAVSDHWRGMEVLDLRTVVIDLRDNKVKIHDNGLWVPREAGAAFNLSKLLARAGNDLNGSNPADAPPMMESALEVDAESILSYDVGADDFEREQPDRRGWGEDWGNGKGSPPEIYTFVERLEAAGVPTDRFSQLRFGAKKPNERYGNRGPEDGLFGNYGVEIGLPFDRHQQADYDGIHDERILANDALIVVDVDEPEDAPILDLPETLAVSSPHGDDDRAHHFYRLPSLEAKEAVYDHFDSWAVKPGWGDVWLAGEFVVGPGSYIETCTKPSHGSSCPVNDPENGFYDVVVDTEIETLEADDLIEMLEDSWTLEETPDPDPEPVETEVAVDAGDDRDDQDDDTQLVECHDCGAEIDPDDARLTDRDGSPAYVCGGECQ